MLALVCHVGEVAWTYVRVFLDAIDDFFNDDDDDDDGDFFYHNSVRYA